MTVAGSPFPRALRTYVVASDSPRLYASTNPWKVVASFDTIATTVEEYVKVIEALKSALPKEEPGAKRKKFEKMHLDLIKKLEARSEVVNDELTVSVSLCAHTATTAPFQRIERARSRDARARKDAALARQVADTRETRTRRQTKKAQYVYNDASDVSGSSNLCPQG